MWNLRTRGSQSVKSLPNEHLKKLTMGTLRGHKPKTL